LRSSQFLATGTSWLLIFIVYAQKTHQAAVLTTFSVKFNTGLILRLFYCSLLRCYTAKRCTLSNTLFAF